MAEPETAEFKLQSFQWNVQNSEPFGYNNDPAWGPYLMMLAFTQALYLQVCAPILPTGKRGWHFALSGQGRIQFSELPTASWKIGPVFCVATSEPIEIVSERGVPAQSNDEVHTNYGRCGFMRENLYGDTEFINWKQSYFYPPTGEEDGFWYQLNKGVSMNVLVEARGSQDFGLVIAGPQLNVVINPENYNISTIPPSNSIYSPLLFPDLQAVAPGSSGGSESP